MGAPLSSALYLLVSCAILVLRFRFRSRRGELNRPSARRRRRCRVDRRRDRCRSFRPRQPPARPWASSRPSPASPARRSAPVRRASRRSRRARSCRSCRPTTRADDFGESLVGRSSLGVEGCSGARRLAGGLRRGALARRCLRRRRGRGFRGACRLIGSALAGADRRSVRPQRDCADRFRTGNSDGIDGAVAPGGATSGVLPVAASAVGSDPAGGFA